MAINTAYNYWRTDKRRLQRDQEYADPASQHISSSEVALLHREEVKAVREVLAIMEERDRTLLTLRYAGYSYDELAEAIAVEKSSVGTLLARARRKFRNLYECKRGVEV